MTNIEIGNRIKRARDLRDVTLDDIAKKVGVAKSTIQRYENGKINTIKIPVVESIAIALNVNPSWLVGKSDIMELPTQKVPKIIEYYELLNDTGKHEATKRVEEMTHAPQYMKEDTDHLAVNAAHNDAEITDAELEKMERDSALIVEMAKKKR